MSEDRPASTPESARWHLLWSGAGTLVPAVVALWALPQYTAVLGTDAFGVLTVLWALVGWFSVADLGLSRAVTQRVARALSRNDSDGARAAVWSALFLMLPIALLVGAGVALAADPIAAIISANAPLQDATRRSLHWVGVAIPVTVLMTALRGVLEGARAFRVLAVLKVPFGIAFTLVPLWMVSARPGLDQVLRGIVVVRIAAVLAHAVAAWSVLPGLRTISTLDRTGTRELLAFGGWSTVVYSVGPLLNALDRFMLAALAPVSALAAYGVASEVGTKVWMINTIVLPVQFAWFASTVYTAPRDAARQYARGLQLLALTAFPILLLPLVGGDTLFVQWMGGRIGGDAALLLVIMSVGLMANTVAQGAQTFVQAAGRPAYTAIGYLWQLPLMALAMYLIAPRHGAVGVAAVWSARCVVDAAWCLWAAEDLVPEVRVVRTRAVLSVGLPTIVLLAAAVWRWSNVV